jgi:hypothetical protein
LLEHSESPPSTGRIIGVTGVPTPAADIPVSGIANFTRMLVVGEAYIGSGGNKPSVYSLAPSTLTAQVNFATRRIAFTLTLVARPEAGGADVPLITVSGTTDFDGDSPSVTIMPSSSRNRIFAMGAALFGTAGAEAGGSFSYIGDTPDGAGVQLVGRFAGAR